MSDDGATPDIVADLAALIKRIERLEAQIPPPPPDRFTRLIVWDSSSAGAAS